MNTLFRFAITPALGGRVNMEIDRYLAQEKSPEIPVVRLFTWRCPTISLGCNQNPAARIDSLLCHRDGIDVVVRPTGGRELVHGHDLCYSVIWPTEGICTGVLAKDMFDRINEALVWILRQFGIEAACSDTGRRRGVSNGPCFAQIDSGEITRLRNDKIHRFDVGIVELYQQGAIIWVYEEE